MSLLTACLQAVALVGPIFGYVLGSLFAKLYVDLGFVNTGKHSTDLCLSYCFGFALLFLVLMFFHSVLFTLYQSNSCCIIFLAACLIYLFFFL